MTLTSGLRADYQALVEKRNMAWLRNANQARTRGQKVLAADPNYYDGYLASGSSNHIVGNLAARHPLAAADAGNLWRQGGRASGVEANG